MSHVRTRQILHAKAWLHPRPGLTVDELAERVSLIPGNRVLEVHYGCDCRHGSSGGARTTGIPDDHLLMADTKSEEG